MPRQNHDPTLLISFTVSYARQAGAQREFGRKGLTLNFCPGCSFGERSNAMQLGLVSKTIGQTVDVISFCEQHSCGRRMKMTRFFLVSGLSCTLALMVFPALARQNDQKRAPQTTGEAVAGTFAWGHGLSYVRNHFVKAAEEFAE